MSKSYLNYDQDWYVHVQLKPDSFTLILGHLYSFTLILGHLNSFTLIDSGTSVQFHFDRFWDICTVSL